MSRPGLFALFFLTACSPEGEPQVKPATPGKSGEEPKPVPGEAAAVPFKQLGWDSATSRFTFNGQPFTGVTTDFYKPSGKLKARYHVKEGVYDGLVEEWYDNKSGQQKTKTSYANSKHEGDNFYWNADGTLQVHKVWKNDVLVSEMPGPAQ
jgi:hypothetical protein